MAVQGNLQFLDVAILKAPVQVLPQSHLGQFHRKHLFLVFLLRFSDRQRGDGHERYEMMAVVVVAYASHVLMLLLNHHDIVFGEHFAVENKFLVDSAFEGGAGRQGLELANFAMVEHDVAVLWPGQLISVFLVEAGTTGLDDII